MAACDIKIRLKRFLTLAVLAGAVLCGLSGCGEFDSGYYFVTAGDVAGPAGGEVPVVFRLMREEILWISSTVDEQPAVIDIKGAPLRAAITDDKGYGKAIVQLPETRGECDMKLAFQDVRGMQASQELYCWSYALDEPLAVIDADEVLADVTRFKPLMDALVADGWQFCYYSSEVSGSRDSASASGSVRARLKKASLPQAAVLPAPAGDENSGPVALLVKSFDRPAAEDLQQYTDTGAMSFYKPKVFSPVGETDK